MKSLKIMIMILFLCQKLHAQKDHTWSPPPVKIIAKSIDHGDCDLYGHGSWECNFRMKIQGDKLILEGDITFSENYGDHTQISGSYKHSYPLSQIISGYQRGSTISLSQNTGSVGGDIRSTEIRHFQGNGFISSADVRTDNAGCDDGKVGGKINFDDIIITVD